MSTMAFLLLATLLDALRSRVALQLEVLALRQQLATRPFGIDLCTGVRRDGLLDAERLRGLFAALVLSR